MIQRIRIPSPDGDINRDRRLDDGGPLGDDDVRLIQYSHSPTAIGGSLVAHSIQTQPTRPGPKGRNGGAA